jgi:hypothetical protein
MSGLDLRTAEGIRTGGTTVRWWSPQSRSQVGHSSSRIRKANNAAWKKLGDADLDILRRWIEAGASFDGFDRLGVTTTKSEETAGIPERAFTAEERSSGTSIA